MAAPNDAANIVIRIGDRRIVTASEEDAAVPQGSFTSTMAAPRISGPAIKLAAAGPASVSEISLSEIVAASLE
jgi:hypothetical protein